MTTCHACDPANPDRIFTPAADGWRASFEPHFNGPPSVVNGGVAAGSLACPAVAWAQREGARQPVLLRVNARLRRPVPVATDLFAVAAPGAEGAIHVNVRRGDEPLVVGTVRVADVQRPPGHGDALQPAPDHLVDTLAAMSRIALEAPGALAVRHEDHPFPGCYSCGPMNPRGLRIFPRTTSTNAVSAFWRPAVGHVETTGAIPSATVAAALDCSNAMALSTAHEEMDGMRALEPLLASFDMHVLKVPPAGRPDAYRVVGLATGADGRRKFSVSALFDAAGELYAVAETAWVLLPKGSFG
ncbi:MAG: hypothetical protein EPO22_03545 [Dehalococcoidia bacterium]|nr:MAG: hypothetical protein EPO22_03545 [Dehalococcoidia bacterium]